MILEPALLDTGPKIDPSKVQIILPPEETAPPSGSPDDDLERQFKQGR